MTQSFEISDEAAMRRLGAELSGDLQVGDVVLLEGELGAGKTTLVRGVLQGLGYAEPVRSPTFNLIQTYLTKPPVMHADLYRVGSYQGIGLEDYLETHLCFIEWPDRATGLVHPQECWRIQISFTPTGRTVEVIKP